ncbi:MAG: HAMP domain-containing sensor histidine kinase [Chloroflexota bacterium]
MLRRLRIQLTILYTLAAIGLVALVSFSAYQLLGYYFQRETDLALNYKMSTLFKQYALELPPELKDAEQSWQATKSLQLPELPGLRSTATPARPSRTYPGVDDDGDGDGDEYGGGEHAQTTVPLSGLEGEIDERYDAQLSSIFVLSIDASGQVVAGPGFVQPPFSQDQEASQAALKNGSDLRTILLASGERVRLLTYRVDSPNELLLQIGRTLADQDRVLRQFLYGLLLLGAASSVLLGFGSWQLSGQTLGPAQRSWDQQQAFISNASHELRTPLTLIKASAEFGLRSQPGEEHQQLLQDILGECDYMDRLVDDLLLLSRLDTHRLKLGREPVSLSNLLGETAQQAQKLALQKDIHLEVVRAQGVVWGDPTRLRQVLLILLDNAMRFTPDGGSIRLEAAQKRKTCQIMVSDNGCGIAPEHLPHIFERFYQANPTGEAQARSNGLGLSIAKGLMQAQGGEISIQSQPGQGTRVTLELPGAAQRF